MGINSKSNTALPLKTISSAGQGVIDCVQLTLNLLVAECHKIQSFIYFRESRFDKNQNFMSFIQSIVSFYNIPRGFIRSDDSSISNS